MDNYFSPLDSADPRPASEVEREQMLRYRHRPPRQELRAAAPRVWPNENWFDENLGIRDPSILDKYGQVQSALYSFADGVTMGIPSAIAKRFAPDTMKGVDDVVRSHPVASGVSNVGGFYEKADGRKAIERGFDVSTGLGAAKFATSLVGSGGDPKPGSREWWESTSKRSNSFFEIGGGPGYDRGGP